MKNLKPLGYVWEMNDGSRIVMWEPLDDDAFYCEPMHGTYKAFTKIYGPDVVESHKKLVEVLEEIRDGYIPNIQQFTNEIESVAPEANEFVGEMYNAVCDAITDNTFKE